MEESIPPEDTADDQAGVMDGTEVDYSQPFVYPPYQGADASLTGQEFSSWNMYTVEPPASIFQTTEMMMTPFPHAGFQSPWTDPVNGSAYYQAIPPIHYSFDDHQKPLRQRNNSYRKRTSSEQTVESEDDCYVPCRDDQYDMSSENDPNVSFEFDDQYEHGNDEDTAQSRPVKRSSRNAASVRVNMSSHDGRSDIYGSRHFGGRESGGRGRGFSGQTRDVYRARHRPDRRRGESYRGEFNPKLNSDEQFPSLGSQGNLTKKQLRSIQEKETGAFRERRSGDSGSRRLRRRTAGRSAPRGALKLSEYIPGKNGPPDEMSASTVHRGGFPLNISVDEVNNAAIGIILDMDSKGQHVTAQDVIEKVCQQYGKSCLEELGLFSPEEISCVKKLNWKQEKINAYLHAYDSIQAIGTLYDLSHDLAQLFEKMDFAELHMGPLLAQPELWKIFSLPCSGMHMSRIPEISTSEVMLHLRNFMDKSDLWKKNVDISEFKHYLSQQYNVIDPESLGIRIRRLGLAISVIRKAKDAQRLTMDKTKAQFIRDFEQRLEEKLKEVRGHFVESMTDTSSTQASSSSTSSLTIAMDLRRHYVEMDAVDVVTDVLKNCDDLFINHQLKYLFLQFLTSVQHDQLARKMFQLALCLGKLDKPEDLAPKYHFSAGRQPTDQGEEETTPKPTEDQLLRYLRDCIEKCSGHLSLKTWYHIEDTITSHFGFTSFKDLGHGTFLHFIQGHSEILAEYGMASFLVSSGVSSKSSSHVPCRQEVEEFIRQFGFQSYDKNEVEQIEHGLKVHYELDSVMSLGHGSLARLIESVKRDKARGSLLDTKVFYEAPFTAGGSSYSCQRDVGLLGSFSKDHALAMLRTTPLLEDLTEWSRWTLVFQAQFGPLKSFIKKYSGKVLQLTDDVPSTDSINDLIALETEPGKLLRITGNTSPRSFSAALNKLDARLTCGHLVSIIIKDGGVHQAPIALLAEYVKTLFDKLEEDFGTNQGGGGDAGNSISSKKQVLCFVRECLILLPSLLCQAVGRQVFLSPLGQVFGKKEAEALLLETSGNERERRDLEKVGLLLGIKDWFAGFEIKMYTVSDTLDQDASGTELLDDADLSTNLDLESLKEDIMLTQLLGSDSHSDQQQNEETEDDRTDEAPPPPELKIENENIEQEAAEGPVDVICNENECKSIVHDIRQNRFGIGLDLDERTKEYTTQLMELIGRSLETLSKELYNKDTHFVLELIQNADDNTYDAGKEPALVFLVEKDRICLFNNETGFWKENIDAVCNVRKSTKLINGKHKEGYIGQKGIGFKSVFTVTDTPEIHSNGFHIKFDAKNEKSGVGYILPHWIPEEERLGDDDVLEELKEINNEQSWNTKIALPLKAESEREKHRSRSLTASFHDIHPSLLLFLHRLKRLTLLNKVRGETMHMVRTDVGNNVVEIQNGNKADQWLVVRKTLAVSEEMNPDVACTELALAFPLLNNNTTNLTTKLAKQDVFAFLPLRSFGFNFIVQGDFEIPSSRQDIHHNNHWNQWLRSEIPLLFVEALDSFKAHPDYSEVSAVGIYLKFVPLEGEIIEFFQPVVKDIMKRLSEKEWLPICSGENGKIQWKQPSDVVICSDPLLKEVITPQLLHCHLGWYYLHDGVHTSDNLPLFSSLGVHTLEAAHVMEVFRAVVQEFEGNSKALSLGTLHIWFVCLYQSMESFRTSSDVRLRAEYDSILESLRSLAILPLYDGSRVALKNTAVFFSDKLIGGYADDITRQVLETDLRIVSLDLFGNNEEQNAKVRMLLKAIGVKDIMPNEVIEKHIFPVLESDEWKQKSSNILLAYISYIQQQWERDRRSVNMSRFRAVARVQTNKGFVTPATEAVHFTVDYMNKYDLKQLFPYHDWTLLSNSYIKSITLKASQASWRAFFDNLGVTDFLKVRKERVILKPDELVNTAWTSCKDLLSITVSRFFIDDFVCPEFLDLIQGNVSDSVKVLHMKNMFAILNKYWESHYENYVKSTVTDENGKFLKEVDSSFFTHLRQLSWIPVSKAAFSYEANKNVQVSENKVLVKGCEAYARTPFIQNMVGLHVPLLLGELPMSGSFVHFLQIKTEISVNELKNLLVAWCTGRPVDDNANIKGGVVQSSEPRTEFYTSLEEIKNVYKFLHKHMDEEEFCMLFDQYPALFIPVTKVTGDVPNTSTVVTKGMFYYVSEACWHDPTKMFGKYRPSFIDTQTGQRFKRLLVRAHYQDIEQIFCNDLNLAYTPTIEEYVLLLEHITPQVRLPDRSCLEDVFSIFSLLGELCVKRIKSKERFWQKAYRPKDPKKTILDESNVSSLTHALKGKKVFPTKCNRWVSLEDRPMVADDKRLAEIFSKETNDCQVNFIQFVETYQRGDLDEDDDPRLSWILPKVFFHAVGICLLSDCVETKIIPDSQGPCPVVQAYVQRILPYLQLLMLSRPRYRSIYDQLIESKIHLQLRSLTIYRAKRIEAIFTLRTMQNVRISMTKKVCYNVKANILFVQDESFSDHNQINREILRIFLPPGSEELELDICNFLMILSTSPNHETFMKYQGLCELPPSEVPWTISELPGHPKPVTHDLTISPDINWTEEDEYMRTRYSHKNKGSTRSWAPSRSKIQETEEVDKCPEDHQVTPLPPKRPFVAVAPMRKITATVSISASKDTAVDDLRDSGNEDEEPHQLRKGKKYRPPELREDTKTADKSPTVDHMDDEENSNHGDKKKKKKKLKNKSKSDGDGDEMKGGQAGSVLDWVTGNPASGAIMDEAKYLKQGSKIEDIPFEDITDRVHHDLPILPDQSGRSEVGCWGERWVYDYLCQKYQDEIKKNYLQVVWLNQKNETGSPYDIKVDFATQDAFYIEVKSTQSETKDYFEISPNEVELAKKLKEKYHIYRLYNAGNCDNVKLKILRNASAMMDVRTVLLLLQL